MLKFPSQVELDDRAMEVDGSTAQRRQQGDQRTEGGVVQVEEWVGEIRRFAETHLSAQLQAADALDSKAGVLLGFNAIFDGLFFPQHILGLLPYFVAGATLLSIVSACVVLWPRDYQGWPDAEQFYKKFLDPEADSGTGSGEGSSLDPGRQLLREIIEAQNQVDEVLAQKARWLSITVIGLALAVLLGVVGLVLP